MKDFYDGSDFEKGHSSCLFNRMTIICAFLWPKTFYGPCSPSSSMQSRPLDELHSKNARNEIKKVLCSFFSSQKYVWYLTSSFRLSFVQRRKRKKCKKWRHFSIQLNANFDFTALRRNATLKAGKLHLELEVNK